MNWNRRTRLLVGYGLILTMNFAVGLIGLYAARSLSGDLHQVGSIAAPGVS